MNRIDTIRNSFTRSVSGKSAAAFIIPMALSFALAGQGFTSKSNDPIVGNKEKITAFYNEPTAWPENARLGTGSDALLYSDKNACIALVVTFGQDVPAVKRAKALNYFHDRVFDGVNLQSFVTNDLPGAGFISSVFINGHRQKMGGDYYDFDNLKKFSSRFIDVYNGFYRPETIGMVDFGLKN